MSDGGKGEGKVKAGPGEIRWFDELGVDGSGGIVIGRGRVAS